MSKRFAVFTAMCLLVVGTINMTAQTIKNKTIKKMEVKDKKTETNIIAENDKLRTFYHNYIAAANARNFTEISKLVADKVILNGETKTREDVIAAFHGLLDAMPNISWKLEHLTIEEDRISARLTDTATPKENSFFGANPKGTTVKFTEFASYKVQNGLFVEMWFMIDVPSITQQLM